MTQWKPFFFLGTPTLLTTQKDARLCVRNRTTGKHWNWDNSDWRQGYISRCMRRRGRLLQSGVNKLPSIGYWRPATEGRGEMECNVRRTTCRARDRERESRAFPRHSLSALAPASAQYSRTHLALRDSRRQQQRRHRRWPRRHLSPSPKRNHK